MKEEEASNDREKEKGRELHNILSSFVIGFTPLL